MLTSRIKIGINRLTNTLLKDISWQCHKHSSIIQSCTFQLNREFHSSLIYYKRRKTAEERKSHKIIEYAPKAKAPVIGIWKNITVKELADVMGKSLDHIFEVMLYVDNSDDYSDPHSVINNPQVIQDIVVKSGFKYKIIPKPDIHHGHHEAKQRDFVRQLKPDPKSLVKRSPVVTIMGHVDHGKTTLLDSLRHTSIVKQEFGGITQHIGAFSFISESGDRITFLDTPGHAAFSAMRARGANVTDLVILVVAADDGVMEQTVESIRMAKEANVPIIVAINKIDKPEADIERTKRMLMQHGIQVEDMGGDVQTIPISALNGTNLDHLTEAIIVQSEMMDLKGDPKGMVEGVIIESRVDSRRGKLSTAIVQRGTLHKGTVLIAGNAWARVRAMFDSEGLNVNEASLSTPIEILGWRDLPSAGEEMLEVESEKRAHEIMHYRAHKRLEDKQHEDASAVQIKTAEHEAAYKAQLEHKRKLGRFRLKPTGPRQKEIQKENEGPRVGVIIKGDVDGSVEAILDVLETYNLNNQCKLDLVHYGVGNVSENDIELAEIFNASIYKFNVECLPKITDLAKSKNITLKSHNVIYKLIDDLKEEISSKLPNNEVEEVLGEANVLQQFIITEGKKKVPVAGCRCTKGILKKNAIYKVIREEEEIFKGKLLSMRHLKTEVDSVKNDVECGLHFQDAAVEFKSGDKIICYQTKKVPQTTEWDPGF